MATAFRRAQIHAFQAQVLAPVADLESDVAGFWLLCHVYVVGLEEKLLRRRFGAEYEAYCREVPRWLPRLRRGPSASE